MTDVAALLAGGGLTACSTGPETGDCVEKSGDSSTATTLAGMDECSGVAGASSSYSWDMVATGDGPYGLNRIQGLGVDLLFCLGPAGVDPNSSPDAAQAGDCLAETSGDPGYTKVDCGAPDVRYRVVERVDGGFLGIDFACRSAPGATWDPAR